MKTVKKKIWAILASATILVTSMSVFAGYDASGFGDMNQYYATLNAQRKQVIAQTSGTGDGKLTNVYGTLSNGETHSDTGASVASVELNTSDYRYFTEASSVHWVGKYSKYLYTPFLLVIDLFCGGGRYKRPPF